jgi:TonB family protein
MKLRLVVLITFLAVMTQPVTPQQTQKPTASLKQLFVQGQLLYAQKRYNEAAGMFEQALPLARERNIPIVLFSLADAWSGAASVETNPPTREQDQARALDYYQKALQADPNNAALHNSLGSLYASLGRLADAAAESKKAADLDPAHDSSYHHNFDQGQSLYVQKHYNEAAGMYEQALPLARGKNVPIVLFMLADAWSKAASIETNPVTREQDQARALDYCQKALQAAPNDAALHNSLGKLYADMSKPTDAAAEFKKAADLDPAKASGYYYNLGAIMVNKGQMDQAAIALKKATDLDPTNATAWYWYGMALMGKGEVKPDGTLVPAPGTIEAFQTYLKLAPDGPYAPPAQASLDALNGKTDTEYRKRPLPSPNEAVPIRIRVGGQVQSTRLIFQPKGEYPPQAKILRIQGVVRLDAVIGKDGTVEELKVISGHPLLNKAALDAVQRWRYHPVLLNGNAVQVATEIDVNFTLAE